MFLLNALRQKKIGIMVVLLLIGVSIYYLLFIFESSEVKAEKKAVAQYLKEKYGQDFVIKKVEYFTAALGDKKQIRTYVISKDEKPVEFIVTRFANESEAKHLEAALFFGQIRHVSYLDLKWQEETTVKFQEIATKIFFQPVLLYTNISIAGSYANQIFGATPSYFKTLETNPGVFSDKMTAQFIQLVFFYDINKTDKTKEVDKIYSFMNELQKMGISNYRLGIDYFPPDYVIEAQKVIDYIGVEAFDQVEKGNLKIRGYSKSGNRINFIFLKQMDVESIKKSIDILNYFQK